MTDDTLDELVPMLRAAVDDPLASTDELSRLSGLTLLEVARARRMPPDVARRSGAGLWREAQERAPDTFEAVRVHARMILGFAARVSR